MFSNVGRAAIRRVGIRASHPANGRVGQWRWQLQRVFVSQDSSYASQAIFRPQLQYSMKRSYVTATKAAAKPRATRTTTTKATKNPAKKVTKKVAKPKVKAKPKKKAKAKKAKPVKKVLTEEQKAKRAEVKAKADIKALKATALLNQPKGLPSTAWSVLLAEAMKEAVGITGKSGITATAAGAAARYKSLTASERESYNHIANQNKAANEVAYKKWVESHTPDAIRIANLARAQIKRKKLVARMPSPESIRDIRQPSRGVSNPRAAFMSARHSSGDMKGIPFAEASRAINKEWTELSAAEKKPFEDQAASDRRRYEQEYKTVFHRALPTRRAPTTA